MIVGIDTDVLVHWAMTGAPHHRAVRRFVSRELARSSAQIGITPQVVHEFLHVATDPRRFDIPLSMHDAIGLSRALWDANDTARVLPAATVLHRTLELMTTLDLGRKRILDTALAATFEAAGVSRVATLNKSDFRAFSFLEVVDPTRRTR